MNTLKASPPKFVTEDGDEIEIKAVTTIDGLCWLSEVTINGEDKLAIVEYPKIQEKA